MRPVEQQEEVGKIRVFLLDSGVARQQYLAAIFGFIGHEMLSLADEADFAAYFEIASDVSPLVLIGPDLPAAARRSLIRLLLAQTRKPPVFAVDLADPAVADLVDQDLTPLGVLSTPTRYDVIVMALHKAQVFWQTQSASMHKRPMELFRSLSGNSRSIHRVNKMIRQVADSEATVLILGESGTGKEVVARKLHYHSARRGKPFVPVNCGAIPADLLESELFGHEKGAFTGAISTRQGRFEMAEGGTLFLDEIGDMSMPMQVKILRVLQERTFERVGSNKTLQANVRIVAATHRNLEEAITQGRFREDLFYRLNVFPIDMPPLRDRREDIPLLVSDLIARLEKETRGSVRMTPMAVSALAQYAWPGNVRELANLVERLAILYPYGVVDVGDLPEKFRPEGVLEALAAVPALESPVVAAESASDAARLPQDGLDLKAHLNHLELNLIKQALDEADGVVAHAAKRLRMRRTTLVEKLRKYGLQRGQESEI